MKHRRRPFLQPRRQFLSLAGLVGASSLMPLRRVLGAAAPLFEEIPSSTSGINWVHENAMSSNRYLPETMGPGVAFCDYDNDGWMDIFMVNSRVADFYTPQKPLKNALYKNNRDGTFSDVTDKAGVAGGQTFGMGCTIADYDNDGYADILVTAYGSYLSSHDMREVLGLGPSTKVDLIDTKWPLPSGRVERIADPPIDRYVTIVEGKGRIG